MDTLFKTLSEIHRDVLARFTYLTDQEQYGENEKWVMPPDAYTGTQRIVGDCEDFALACRKLCRAANLQSRLVVCRIGDEGHCVLEVNGWILDNTQTKVMSRDELTSHTWLYISGYESGDPWHEIV